MYSPYPQYENMIVVIRKNKQSNYPYDKHELEDDLLGLKVFVKSQQNDHHFAKLLQYHYYAQPHTKSNVYRLLSQHKTNPDSYRAHPILYDKKYQLLVEIIALLQSGQVNMDLLVLVLFFYPDSYRECNYCSFANF